jgi:hypothetical protein
MLLLFRNPFHLFPGGALITAQEDQSRLLAGLEPRYRSSGAC